MICNFEIELKYPVCTKEGLPSKSPALFLYECLTSAYTDENLMEFLNIQLDNSDDNPQDIIIKALNNQSDVERLAYNDEFIWLFNDIISHNEGDSNEMIEVYEITFNEKSYLLGFDGWYSSWGSSEFYKGLKYFTLKKVEINDVSPIN